MAEVKEEKMHQYHKIETIWERNKDGTKKLMPGVWRSEAVQFLKDCNWLWTEKIDGTNIGIHWDGHKVHFQGRTERAQIPAHLLDRLRELFDGETNEQLFEQTFGEAEVILFGEGYGYKIQNGGLYLRDRADFIMFDVYIPEKNLYLRRPDVEEIAGAFGVDVVPIVGEGPLSEAIQYIKGKPMSTIGTHQMEGVVCRPSVEMNDRMGNRIIVKIKERDF